MVANFQEAQDYLRILPVLHNLPKQPFSLVYDPEADVLYIDFYSPPKSSADTEFTEDDIVIRYDDADEIVGLTVLNATRR